MLASRKKKSPVRRSVKPKSIKSSRSKTVRPVKPLYVKSQDRFQKTEFVSLKPKTARSANIVSAMAPGNGISSIMVSTMISKEIRQSQRSFIDNHRILESTKDQIRVLHRLIDSAVSPSFMH